MADQPVTLRSIDYKSTFPFTMIFRCFRVAVHPSKLILAATALILIYIGGCALDVIWPGGAVPGELGLYRESRASVDPSRNFADATKEARETAKSAFEAQLVAAGKDKEKGSLGDIKWFLLDKRDKAVAEAKKTHEDRVKRAEDAYTAAPEDKKADARKARDAALDAAERSRKADIRMAYASASVNYERAKNARGIGLFKHFVDWQLGELNGVLIAVREARWLGNGGALDKLVGFFTVGPVWAVRHHPFFFGIFFLFFLSVWAVFGGAISRIAAVHVARDEKISIRQALRFSTAKFLSFFSAPLIPLIIVGVLGLLLAIAGLLTNIPFLGEIIVGVFFFLALIAGFVMTLVVLGLAGGFNLMYPTIAVEGSDSFDAISRSFSYLYARPWRLAFYSAVAVVYGALCYMFIRYFLDILLMLTHYFTGMFVFREAATTEPLWSALWPGPAVTQRLAWQPDYLSLSFAQDLGAFFIWMWTHLLAALLGGFAISFYFVAGTVIYYLMRKEVDATEYDDVSLEAGEDEFSDAIPSALIPPKEGDLTPPVGQPT